MSINNQKGSVKSSVSLSITIHVIIVGLLLFAPQIKQLPVVKDLIGARTSTDMSIESAIGSTEEVTVSYVEPEKNNIKKLNSTKDAIEVEDSSPAKIEKEDILNVPEKRTSKSKVKKLLAKSDIKPEIKNAPEAFDSKDEDVDLEKEVDKKTDQITKESKEIDTQEKFDADDATKLLADKIDNKLPKLMKNPNPPAAIDHTKEALTGSVGGNAIRDGRKLKQLAGNPKPTYPSSARLRKTQGTVLLKYLVTDNGSVKDIRVLESSGSAELDQEAVSKIQRWKFQPGQAGETTHPVTFKLNGPSKQLPSRLRTSKNG